MNPVQMLLNFPEEDTLSGEEVSNVVEEMMMCEIE